MFSRHRIASWLGRLFRRSEAITIAKATVPTGLVPLELPAWAAWADEAVPPRRPAYRPLAAQLAMQARLNVPAGRKPFVASKPARPVKVTERKRTSGAVGMHLQIRPAVVLPRPAPPPTIVDGSLSAYSRPHIADLAA